LRNLQYEWYHYRGQVTASDAQWAATLGSARK
jgi:hypothetical protein